MKLKLLLTAFCLLGAGAAYAQSSPTPAPEKPAMPTAAPPLVGRAFNDLIPVTDGPTAAAEDTIRAITKLYTRRRIGGFGWITGGTLGGLRSLLAANQPQTVTTPYGSYVLEEKTNGTGVAAGVGMILLIDSYGVSKLMRFSAAKQNALIVAIRAGKPLPAAERRKLKPRFFN